MNNKEAFLPDYSYSGRLDEDNDPILECHVNLLEIPETTENPLSYAYIHKQQRDEKLLALKVFKSLN